jgi:hypothetical protein
MHPQKPGSSPGFFAPWSLRGLIAGFDPAIQLLAKKMDLRIKPAGDAGRWQQGHRFGALDGAHGCCNPANFARAYSFCTKKPCFGKQKAGHCIEIYQFATVECLNLRHFAAAVINAIPGNRCR